VGLIDLEHPRRRRPLLAALRDRPAGAVPLLLRD
jgi:hypothetical protein